MTDDDTRPFPIQGDCGGTDLNGKRRLRTEPSHIPWWLAEIAYEHYNCKSLQSLKRIAERGGFGREELVVLIRKEKF